MIPPVIGAMIAGVILVGLEGLTQRGLLLALILAPFFYLGLEILSRRIQVDASGVTIFKFLRSVRLDWPDLQTFDAVRSGARVYIILLSEEGKPFFITNSIRPFARLIQDLFDNVPDGKITPNARELLEDTPTKHFPLIQACVICLVLIAMVVGRLLGYGA